MHRFKPRRPSASMVVAVLALSLALTGGASAASKLITGKSIKNNSISSSDIKNNSIKSGDVKNRSLLKKDFKSGQLPRGAAGPTGPAGRNGTSGFGTLRYSNAGSFPIPAGESGYLQATCPAGTFPTGGDVGATNATDDFVDNQVIDSDGYSSDTLPDGWIALITNNTAGDVTVFVDAICANATSVAEVNSAKRVIRPKGRNLAKR